MIPDYYLFPFPSSLFLLFRYIPVIYIKIKPPVVGNYSLQMVDNGNRTVTSAGAADSQSELLTPGCLMTAQNKEKKRFKMDQKPATGLIIQHISSHRCFKSGMGS